MELKRTPKLAGTSRQHGQTTAQVAPSGIITKQRTAEMHRRPTRFARWKSRRI